MLRENDVTRALILNNHVFQATHLKICMDAAEICMHAFFSEPVD